MTNLPGHEFGLHAEPQDGALVVAVMGRIDSVNAEDFGRHLEQELAGFDDRAVVLDFHGTSYVSSAGLREILHAAKQRKRAGTRLVLCGVPDAVMQIIRIAGFDKVIDIHADAAAAAASLASD